MGFKPFTRGIFLGVLLTTLLVVTASAQLDPKKYPFPLRAWTDPRGTLPQAFNHYAEWDENTGDVYVDVSAKAEGFKSYLVPDPNGGTLHYYTPGTNINDDKSGYLFPLYDVTTNPPSPLHYQLRYSHGIPLIAGVHATNFTTFGKSCGGHCGGATLAYDNGFDKIQVRWYAISVDGSSKWKLRWIGREKEEDVVVFPEGAVEVTLWKS